MMLDQLSCYLVKNKKYWMEGEYCAFDWDVA